MQGVIAQLLERNEPVPKPLPKPTLEDIARVERELCIKLPSEFVALQLNAGHVVCGTHEPVTITLGSGHTYIGGVADDAWSSGVPREFLPICEENGDYFCLTPDGKVVYWSHNGPTQEFWPSLEAWVSEVWLSDL
jgi:hypothetical protein